MNITFLGAHNIESESTGCMSLVIDDILALDAGSLTRSLSFPAQMKLQAVLLTHQHYDHIQDIPTISMNFTLHDKPLELYAIQPVFDALETHLLNDSLYPDYFRRPAGNPTLRRHVMTPGRETVIAGYKVLPVATIHSVPTTGFQVTAADGKGLFYTSDTGPGLSESWGQVAPDLLIIEVTAPNDREAFARASGHLTPALLQTELESFRTQRGYLPRIITVHMNPLDEAELQDQLSAVAGKLDTTIEMGREGMRVEL